MLRFFEAMELGGNPPFWIYGQVVTNLKWVAILRFPPDFLNIIRIGWQCSAF